MNATFRMRTNDKIDVVRPLSYSNSFKTRVWVFDSDRYVMFFKPLPYKVDAFTAIPQRPKKCGTPRCTRTIASIAAATQWAWAKRQMMNIYFKVVKSALCAVELPRDRLQLIYPKSLTNHFVCYVPHSFSTYVIPVQVVTIKHISYNKFN